jgi:hypothetical protein
MSTLETHFEPMIDLTMRGYVLGCGILSGWSRWLKTMWNSDHRRYCGTIGSTACTSRWAALRRHLSPYALAPLKIMRHPVVSGKSSVGASCSAGLASSSGFAFLARGLEMKHFTLLELVVDREAMVLARRVHQLLEWSPLLFTGGLGGRSVVPTSYSPCRG